MSTIICGALRGSSAVLAIVVAIAIYDPQFGSGRPLQQLAGAKPRARDAQPHDHDAPKVDHPRQTSVTGCFIKAGQANHYVIIDSKSHEKYTFQGPFQLDAYVNQTVKLTGFIQSEDNGNKTFRPESIVLVSPSCG